MKKLLFGAAYYDEYMPYDRLDKDIEMMKKAGINTVRIAESTWSTCEPQDGVFDFSHVERVMDAMEEAGIHVIIGTPTYAVPAWMVKAHPDVIATTKNGAGIYGARQIMDITNPVYLFYAERVIRKLMEVSAGRKCVIGFQVDNETKYYGTAGKNVQLAFVKYLRKKFQDDLDAMNHEFGLDYWSNRIDAWEDFPDVRGTINGSLGAEFEKFQRTLVDQFLSWQAGIVSEYKREDQFITHNLDFEWRGYSYGVQPDVNHLHASQALTIAGTDIYHPSQDDLTGTEIAFGGDMIRSLKHDNYLVLETEAQGFPCWTPYKGQLRLCAYSHLASGANSVMYWHWHSIHNSFETYWRGLLSHDMQPHILSNCFGINYQQFTFPKNTGLTVSIINGGKEESEKAEAKVFMELLMPQEAEVLASYDHYNWKEYAAITKNYYGKGTAIYIGCMTDDNTLKAVLTEALNSAKVEIPEYNWPVIIRKGSNDLGKCVRYILNYSAEEQNVVYHGANGTELFSGEAVQDGETVTVSPWNVKIVEEA